MQSAFTTETLNCVHNLVDQHIQKQYLFTQELKKAQVYKGRLNNESQITWSLFQTGSGEWGVIA